jgi:hypothetical protein
MPTLLAKLSACCLLPAALIAAGCGSDSESDDATTGEAPTETAERVGNLPDGWERLTNDAQGFEIGVPPGWGEGKACGKRAPAAASGTTLLCSPDRLVTLNVSVDRTNEALEVEPSEAATRTAEAISAQNFDGKLDPGSPKRVKGHYNGASLSTEGKAGNVDQEVEVYVLQREGIAVITAVIAANADENADAGVKLAEEAVLSLRTKPVT